MLYICRKYLEQHLKVPSMNISWTSVLRDIFTNSRILCCRFHLGQSWWHKIQVFGLSPQYKENNSEVGKWLKRCYENKNCRMGTVELLIKMSMEGFSPIVCPLVFWWFTSPHFRREFGVNGAVFICRLLLYIKDLARPSTSPWWAWGNKLWNILKSKVWLTEGFKRKCANDT
jgi:hypothetical protein